MTKITDLLEKFPRITSKQWKQKIQFDLNGEDYNERCVWKSHEEISINPFYNQETSNQVHFFHQNTTQITDIAVNTLYDPIGNLSKTGFFFQSQSQDFEKWLVFFQEKNTIYIDASIFSEAGATKIQQIAYTLATLSEYTKLVNFHKNPPIEIIVKLSQQPDFYLEIAKIRALRWILQSLFKTKSSIRLQIISEVSARFISFFQEDSLNNYYQTLWAIQSSIFGGSNSLILPQEVYFCEKEKISRWVLKNLQNIDNKWMNHSFFMDNITLQMAQKSLTLLKNIETGGGYLSQLKNHIIQRKIKEKALLSQTDFDKNYIPKATLQAYAYDFLAPKKSKKTLLEPIIARRFTQKYELQILNQNAH